MVMVIPDLQLTKVKPAIVIPVHQVSLNMDEHTSLKQCQKILGKRDIFLVAPNNLNINIYHDIFPNLKTILVPPDLMKSIGAYNKLMISPLIFNHLYDYSHVLIHEPDALVLKDELDYWCSQEIDYIGAPWPEYCPITKNFIPKQVGNFGFSLINIKSANAVFFKNSRWFLLTMIIRELLRGLRGRKGSIHKTIKACGSAGLLSNASELFEDHCDVFWSFTVPKIEPWFKIANPQQAAYFAWEKNPQSCYEFCQQKIPFGVHAWSKYDRNFLIQLFEKHEIYLEDLSYL